MVSFLKFRLILLSLSANLKILRPSKNCQKIYKNLFMGYWDNQYMFVRVEKKTYEICSKCFLSEWNHISWMFYYWNDFNFFVRLIFFPIFCKGTIFETKNQSAIVLMYLALTYSTYSSLLRDSVMKPDFEKENECLSVETYSQYTHTALFDKEILKV